MLSMDNITEMFLLDVKSGCSRKDTMRTEKKSLHYSSQHPLRPPNSSSNVDINQQVRIKIVGKVSREEVWKFLCVRRIWFWKLNNEKCNIIWHEYRTRHCDLKCIFFVKILCLFILIFLQADRLKLANVN